jgi:site-specific DNA-methyltransferase (adenine-specific)
MLAKDDYDKWFSQIWRLGGASTKGHPAPFPLELETRLIKMFSFHGDTVVDPFCRSGTTMEAALKCERNSIGVEVEDLYCGMIAKRLCKSSDSVFCIWMTKALSIYADDTNSPMLACE